VVIELRDYQQSAIAARREAEAERPAENRQAIVMATGLGKTITFGAEAAAEPGRTLIVAHTEELIGQAEAKVRLMAPGRSVGVVMAGRDETDAEITIGSVATLAVPGRLEAVGKIDRLIIDECHHATAATYQRIIASAGDVPTTGYTATLERGDGASLGRVWHDVAFSRGISWAVRRGHLVPPVGYRVEVPSLQGALTEDRLDQALVDSVAPEAIVSRWLEVAAGRSTVAFAPLVSSARSFASAFIAAGVSAAVIWGDQGKAERRWTLQQYEAGRITVLCNANALTEGWDSPRTEAAILPPTKSRTRVIQRAGRALRPWLDGPKAREDQDAILMFIGDGTADLASFPDLSDHPDLGPARDGQTLTQLEDQFNLNDLGPDEGLGAYTGDLQLVQFDPLVAASTKVWGKTAGGALFVPAGRDSYVAILPGYRVAVVGRRGGGRVTHADVPDVGLAMALAEDVAIDEGGDMGRLLADKSRPWRNGVPSEEAKAAAKAMGLGPDVDRIMRSKAAGKAGKLSDVLDRVQASRVIDPVVARMKEKAGRT
jgi:superfamily II DNA or RNA helicase